MDALAIVGCTVGGTFLGFVAGCWHGDRQNDDNFGITTLLHGVAGAFVGGAVGVVVGAVVFA